MKLDVFEGQLGVFVEVGRDLAGLWVGFDFAGKLGDGA